MDEVSAKTQEHYEVSRTWSAGWDKAWKEYAENASNASKQAEAVFRTTTKGMEDLLYDFVTTGEFRWKAFLQSIVQELLKAQIAKLIAELFQTTVQ